MPLKIPSEFKFPMGITTALDDDTVDDFITLLKKISGPMPHKQIIEEFKKHFCDVSSDSYYPSNSLSWAESDMTGQAYNASRDAPSFIAALYDAIEVLRVQGATVPNVNNINLILRRHNVQYEILNSELIQNNGNVASPDIDECMTTIVMKAINDASALIGDVDSISAIDRAHTALHGYLVALCKDNNIPLAQDPTVSKAFKELRQFHPALQASGNRSDEITRILQSFANSIDAFSTLRNKASLAHVNELLEVPEATATVNAMYTVFRYIQDSIKRHHTKCTPKSY